LTDFRFGLSNTSLKRLLDSLWFYPLSLSTALVYGQLVGAGDEHLVCFLRNMGNILTHAEATGIADSERPENERAWRRVFNERGIPCPEPKKYAAAAPSHRLAPASPHKRTASIPK